MSSFKKIYRLVFVIFSIILMKNAFFQWDGFSYYASITEFMPSLFLVTVLWAIMSLFVALLLWSILKAVEWAVMRSRLKVTVEHLILFVNLFILLGAATWVAKRLILHQTYISFPLKVMSFFCMASTVLFLTWLFRHKSGLLENIDERITPLVWIFGTWTFVSVFSLSYVMLNNQADNVSSVRQAQSFVADITQPNIILVTFDTLTARDMSVYGYKKPTTPFISKWAESATLFSKFQAASNFTTPSAASMMTGKRVWTHGTYHLSGARPDRSETESLPFLLKQKGYYNIALIMNSAASVKTLGIDNSFDVAPPSADFVVAGSLLRNSKLWFDRLFADKIKLHDWIMKEDFIIGRVIIPFADFSVTEEPPSKVFNRFLEIIDGNLPEPFFAWLHVYPPHSPYLAPEPFMGMFDKSSILRTNLTQIKILNMRTFPDKMQPKVDILRNRYDELVRYCDQQFEELIQGLELRNKLKDSIVILSSDHGESFEHNILFHKGPHLYEQLTHIPLIIKEPGQNQGKIINTMTEHIDIPATILDFANISVPSWMEGRSLIPLMRGRDFTPLPVFSMNFEKNMGHGHKITNGTVAVWQGDYKLIHYLETNETKFFDLTQDPDEMINLIGQKNEVEQRLLSIINEKLTTINQKIVPKH